jgi:transposase
MFDRRQTIDKLEALPGVLWSSCQQILTEEPHMKRAAAKFVPHLLSEDQRAKQFLTKNGMTIASHAPYSPDLAPCYFFLFPRMKRDLKGKRFQTVEDVQEKTTEALKAIILQEFQNCFEQWKKQWDKCIDSQGEYFDGD